MKIFGTDISRKWVCFKLDGVYYIVDFYDSFRKGVHQVNVQRGTDGKGYSEIPAKIVSTYPNLKERIKHIWLVRTIWNPFKVRRR